MNILTDLYTQSELDDNRLTEDEQVSGVEADGVSRIALSSTRSRLFIDCADEFDEAVYTCVAENPFARISTHTKLNLIKPQMAESAALEEATLAAALDTELAISSDDNKLSAVAQCLTQRSLRTTGEFTWLLSLYLIYELITN